MIEVKVIEKIARALTVVKGGNPDRIMDNYKPRWRSYVPEALAVLQTISEGEMMIDPEILAHLKESVASDSPTLSFTRETAALLLDAYEDEQARLRMYRVALLQMTYLVDSWVWPLGEAPALALAKSLLGMDNGQGGLPATVDRAEWLMGKIREYAPEIPDKFKYLIRQTLNTEVRSGGPYVETGIISSGWIDGCEETKTEN